MNAPDRPDAYGKSLRALGENEIRELSALALAYIGDTVYDLYVRSFVVKNHMGRVTDLHTISSGVVNARAQAQAAALLSPHLTEREAEIFRLGKNAKSTPPKNMRREDYALATALEAVVGYLYLTGDTQRLDALFCMIIKHFFMEGPHARG